MIEHTELSMRVHILQDYEINDLTGLHAKMLLYKTSCHSKKTRIVWTITSLSRSVPAFHLFNKIESGFQLKFYNAAVDQ